MIVQSPKIQLFSYKHMTENRCYWKQNLQCILSCDIEKSSLVMIRIEYLVSRKNVDIIRQIKSIEWFGEWNVWKKFMQIRCPSYRDSRDSALNLNWLPLSCVEMVRASFQRWSVFNKKGLGRVSAVKVYRRYRCWIKDTQPWGDEE